MQSWLALLIGFLGGLFFIWALMELRLLRNRQFDRALAESERRYRLLAENATDVIWTLRVPDLAYTYISPSVTRMRGLSVEEAMTETLPESVIPEQREWIRRLIVKRIRAFESGRFEQSEAQRVEVQQPCADGSIITVEIIASLDVNRRGEVVGIRGISRNVTARIVAERERQGREAILHGLAKAARMLLGASGMQADLTSALAALGEAVGVDRVYVFENHVEPDSGRLLASQRYEWCGPGVTPEIENPSMQNMDYDETIPNWRPVFESGQPVCGLVEDMDQEERSVLDPQGIISIAVVPIFLEGEFWGQIGFDDCTRKRSWSQAEIDALEVAAGTIGAAIRRLRTEAELRRLVSTDSLTGVSSRRSFLEQAASCFDQARVSGEPMVLMILDLDHFKAINDEHGHPAGDEALKIFARTCRESLRTDDLIGRTGGEEFAILLHSADREKGMWLAERLRSRVEESRVTLETGVIELNVSIGLAVPEPGETEFGALLKRADDALYAAKNSGRNRVVLAAQSR